MSHAARIAERLRALADCVEKGAITVTKVERRREVADTPDGFPKLTGEYSYALHYEKGGDEAAS